MPAQIALGGRVRPGDFNTVKLHTPDLQECGFLYPRGGGGNCPDNLILSSVQLEFSFFSFPCLMSNLSGHFGKIPASILRLPFLTEPTGVGVST